MTIKTEAAKGHESSDERAANAKALADYVKGVVGVSAKVDVADVGGVERSQGKARRVVDLRNK